MLPKEDAVLLEPLAGKLVDLFHDCDFEDDFLRSISTTSSYPGSSAATTLLSLVSVDSVEQQERLFRKQDFQGCLELSVTQWPLLVPAWCRQEFRLDHQ